MTPLGSFVILNYMDKQDINPPTRKGQYNSSVNTTHIRIYSETHAILQRLAARWQTTQIEALRYILDVAQTGSLDPKVD